MSAALTVNALFERIDALPFGREERDLINEAILEADDSGDERLAYRARMRLTVSAKMTGDTDAMLSSFGWCLGKHQSDPDRFPLTIDQLDLLWQFKWMVGTLAASPLFPLAEIHTVITEMTEMYQRANVGLSGVLQARFDEAVENGRLDEAAAIRAELQSTDRDDYSHCEACVRSEDADYLSSIGRTDDAIVKFDEIIEQNLSCGAEPEVSMARSLLPYLRSGLFAKAKAAHLRGYRLARMNDDNIGIIAHHLVFCAVTGNEARGLTMLERHIGWLAHDSLNAIAHFSSLRAIGVLLDAVVLAGHPEAVVRGADATALREFFGEHSGPWTAAALAEASWSAAERLAVAFNERNGNQYYSDLLQQSREMVNERYELVIEGNSFSTPLPVADDESPTDVAGWLLLARERGGVGDLTAALAAARSGLSLADAECSQDLSNVDHNPSRGCGAAAECDADPDAVGAPADPDPCPAPTRADEVLLLHAIVVGALVRQDRMDDAAEALRERIAALRSQRRLDQLWAEERLGLIIHGADNGNGAEAIRSLSTALDEAEIENRAVLTQADIALALGRMTSVVAAAAFEHGSAVERGGGSHEAIRLYRLAIDLAVEDPLGDITQSALMHLAVALVHADDIDRADVTLDHLLDLPIDRALRSAALLLRARLAGARGDFDAALSDADEVLVLQAGLRNRAGIIDACALSAPLLRDSGRVDEAVPRWRLAIGQAELGESETLNRLRFGLGRELVHAGHYEEAADTLTDVYAAELAAGESSSSLAETLYWLGYAYRQGEDSGLAYGPWSRAVELYDEAGQPKESAQAGILLGRLLQEFEDQAAVTVLDAAVATAKRNGDDVETLVAAIHTRGQIKCQFGDPSGLDDFDEVAAIAGRVSADWLAADIRDSRARGLHRLGKGTEAVPYALQAADGYAASGDRLAAGLAELFAARILVEQHNREAAIPIYQSTRERLADQDQAFVVASFELGDVFEALGRHSDASRVRSEAELRQSA
jgi:tetratricopeptide (TPR) repeat protein